MAIEGHERPRPASERFSLWHLVRWWLALLAVAIALGWWFGR